MNDPTHAPAPARVTNPDCVDPQPHEGHTLASPGGNKPGAFCGGRDVGPDDVTPERAVMLAMHAIHVQGGTSDPEREAERARAQLASSPGSIDWDAMQAELDAAYAAAEEPPPDPGETAGIPLAKLRRYRELRDAAAASEAEAKALKDEATLLEAELVEAFSEAGTQSVNIDGKTIYLHRSTFAQRKPGMTAEDVKAALRESGAEELVTETVNAQTLSAWVRELVEAAEDGRGPGLPEPAAAVLELGERYAVRIRASASKAKR